MDSQQDKLSALMDQFTNVSNHLYKLDTHYRLNRLDDIDTLLTNVTEIMEELDMSCRWSDFQTTPDSVHPDSVHPNLTILATTSQTDHDIYPNKVADYVTNKKIMKQLMPLYCALWIKYR